MEEEFQGGFPESAVPTEGGLRVVFRNIPTSDFIDPFSHETVIRQTAARRFEKTFSWEEISRFGNAGVGRTPKGIVMHPARVGSTLIVACLRCVDGLVPYLPP